MANVSKESASGRRSRCRSIRFMRQAGTRSWIVRGKCSPRGSRDSGMVVTPLIGAQNVGNFWLQLISVALSVIVGVLFVRHPGGGLLTLTLLLIVFFMVEGISKLIF